MAAWSRLAMPSPERWPAILILLAPDAGDPELKKTVVHATNKVPNRDPLDKLITSILNWTRLLTILAYFALTSEVHRRQTKFSGPLEADHLERVEQVRPPSTATVLPLDRRCYQRPSGRDL